MRAIYAPMSVGDYCNDLNDNKIIVNDEYQRNAGVWSSYARSFFIESILLEYPIPKIFLYAKVDLKTRQSVKEIVDGQQRSHALQNFYNRKFKLSSKLETEDLRGKNYNQITEGYQGIFLGYSLPIDEFRGVQPVEIQESFRRMNASNVPLNEEEQRNAKFQGPFKWFIQDISHRFSEPLRAVGVLSRRDIIRMLDTRIFSEVVHTISVGFITTKAAQLDSLYRRYNSAFEESALYEKLLTYGVMRILNDTTFHERELLRGYMFQTLMLVLIDREFNLGLKAKAAAIAPEVADAVNDAEIDLPVLIDGLREPDEHPQLTEFVASTKGTNVARAKAVRFLFLDAAV